MPVFKRLVIYLAIAGLLCAGGWYAMAQVWEGGSGSYADSNPMLIPAGNENPTAAEGWSNYE